MMPNPKHGNVVHAVDPGSPGFAEVYALYRVHSTKLGFLPRGAFEQFATEGQVLACRVDGSLAGYLAYRTSRNFVVVVHLCVAKQFRGNGVARSLMTTLVNTEKHETFRLTCRTDYSEANRIWPRFGFVIRGERPGRGITPTTLFLWERRSGDLPLLAAIQVANLEHREKAVLDANVFYDLHDNTVHSEESAALLADWLEPSVALCVTAELLNEISRNQSEESRILRRSQVARFELLEASPEEAERAADTIGQLLPPAQSVADESDRRQLAHAVVKGARYFITRDRALLDASDVLRTSLQIKTLRPTDFLVDVHADFEPLRYAPANLVATKVHTRRVRSESEMAPFQQFGHRESKSFWLTKSRVLLRDLGARECRVVLPANSDPRVLYSINRSVSDELAVETFRTLAHRLTPTLVRRIVSEVLELATAENRRLVRVTDFRDTIVEEALVELGFAKTEIGYVKWLVPRITSDVDARLLFETYHGMGPTEPTQMDLERTLWPLKVKNSAVPSFILPIQPKWAAHLFDSELASRDLFGADHGPALALENVYYSKSRVRLPPGARILWYVSRDGRDSVQEIRACSLCLETVRAPARRVYSQFSRLGVYRWSHVLDAVKGNQASPLTAFRFAYTERFAHPIPWTRLQKVLKEHMGKGRQIIGPTRVTPAVFAELYAKATNRDER
jgi:predicted nucleic acid-binding protein